MINLFDLGKWPDQSINQVLCFDPSTNQWSTQASIPTSRYGVKLVWFENRIWAIGGNDGSYTNCEVDSYDPTTRFLGKRNITFTTLEIGCPLGLANGNIFIVGRYGSAK